MRKHGYGYLFLGAMTAALLSGGTSLFEFHKQGRQREIT